MAERNEVVAERNEVVAERRLHLNQQTEKNSSKDRIAIQVVERNAFEEPEKPTVIQKAREQLKQSRDPGF